MSDDSNFITVQCLIVTLKEKTGVMLKQKVESLADLKFDPGFWVIGEYLSQIDSKLRVNLNWLSILSQLDSNTILTANETKCSTNNIKCRLNQKKLWNFH